MEKIIIIGGRGTAIVIADQIYDAATRFGKEIEVLGLALDDHSNGDDVTGYPILCDIKDLYMKYGKYEDIKYATGTREMLTNIVNSKAIKIVGGGDGVSAVKNFNLQDRFNFLSTGGGATLEYIINEGLPAIDNISEKE